jgi:hypothetical protein
MSLYLEESSLMGNCAAACIDPAPHTDVEEAIAAGRKQRRRCPAGDPRARPAPAAEDAIEPGAYARCGCMADHPTSAECIDQLRYKIAELTGGEMRAR